MKRTILLIIITVIFVLNVCISNRWHRSVLRPRAHILRRIGLHPWCRRGRASEGALIGMYGQGGFPIFAEQKNPNFFSCVLRRPGRSGEDPALTTRYDLFNRFLHSCRFVCSKNKFQIPPDFDDATGGEIKFGRAVMVREERFYFLEFLKVRFFLIAGNCEDLNTTSLSLSLFPRSRLRAISSTPGG